MSTLTTIDLKGIAERYKEAAKTTTRRVIICAGTGCVANGSLKVYAAFLRSIREHGLDVDTELRIEEENAPNLVTKSGCQGFCQMGPLVTVEPDDILYCRVKAEDVPEIVRETLLLHEPVQRLLYKDHGTGRRCCANAACSTPKASKNTSPTAATRARARRTSR